MGAATVLSTAGAQLWRRPPVRGSMTPLIRELDSPLHRVDMVSDKQPNAQSDTEIHKGETPPTVGDKHQRDSTIAAEGYTITQAATLLGVHTNTLRKRIRTGKLHAVLVDGPTGQEYRIHTTDIQALAEAHRRPASVGSQTSAWEPDSSVSDSAPHRASSEVDTGETPPSGSGPYQSDSTVVAPSTAIQSAARAREMAIYTEELLGPWRRRVEDQAEEIGRLKAELRHAQTVAQEALQSVDHRDSEQGPVAETIELLRAELQQVRHGLSEQTKAAEETGRLKAELEQAQRRVAEVEATMKEPEREHEATEELRPWWKFW